MKLIIEKWNGRVYVFPETDEVFLKNQETRGGWAHSADDLAEECDLAKYGDGYWVFEIGGQP